MRITPAEFRQKPFRVHALLADVPLHDVWVARLRGDRPPHKMQHVLKLFAGPELERVNPVVRLLFALRRGVGRAFKWDEEGFEPGRSYAARLSAEERAGSLEPPGTRNGPFRIVYVFEDEALLEAINKTVHAFIACAMEPGANGQKLYLAIYVKPVSRFTAFYMALIDPFRRFVIYPALIRRIERQ